MSAADKEDGHKGEGDDSHGGADGEVDAEIDVFYGQVGHKQKSDSHCRGDQIVLADVCAFADNAAEIRHSQGDESYRAADRDCAGHKEHDCK